MNQPNLNQTNYLCTKLHGQNRLEWIKINKTKETKNELHDFYNYFKSLKIVVLVTG